MSSKKGNIEAITDLINYWYNASIKSEYADIMEIAYTEPLNWPNKKVWVGYGDFDEDDFYNIVEEYKKVLN